MRFPARLTRRRSSHEPTARAKAKGIKIGRPKLGFEIRQKIAQRAKKGETPYAKNPHHHQMAPARLALVLVSARPNANGLVRHDEIKGVPPWTVGR
jgi:hypothetical protein